jgi:hypothetical protein
MMIKHGSVLLKLSGQVSATACSIFHRFFYRYSFFEHDPRLFAAASLFLSAKLEETPRKYKDVISVFHIISQQFNNLEELTCLDLSSYELIDKKEALMTGERILIKELGF